jgi:hypothetical protein
LILTDDLIREALRRDKALREAQGETVVDEASADNDNESGEPAN